MLLMDGANGTGAVVSSDLVPITGGLTYALVFDAANPVQVNGGNPQYQIQFFDAGNTFISATGFQQPDIGGLRLDQRQQQLCGARKCGQHGAAIP